MARRIIYNVQTKELRVEEFEHTSSPPGPEPTRVDIEELKKLLDYAKTMRWI